VQLGANQRKVAGWMAGLIPGTVFERVESLKKILQICIIVDTVNNFADPQTRIV